MSTAKRILGAGVVAALPLLGIALPYSVLHWPPLWTAIIAAAVVGGIIFIKRLATGAPTFRVEGCVVGAVLGLVAIGNLFQYRETPAAWGLTPETLSAQTVFGMLCFLGSGLGALVGSYVSVRPAAKRRPAPERDGGRPDS